MRNHLWRGDSPGRPIQWDHQDRPDHYRRGQLLVYDEPSPDGPQGSLRQAHYEAHVAETDAWSEYDDLLRAFPVDFGNLITQHAPTFQGA